jgi:hypothetical protein
MIVRDYYQNINVRNPRDYFEKWYADVWKRRIGKHTAPPGILERILDEELEQVGATYTNTDRGYRFRVYFDNDQDYTMFVLRWS